jgi:hypothetical protein
MNILDKPINVLGQMLERGTALSLQAQTKRIKLRPHYALCNVFTGPDHRKHLSFKSVEGIVRRVKGKGGL